MKRIANIRKVTIVVLAAITTFAIAACRGQERPAAGDAGATPPAQQNDGTGNSPPPLPAPGGIDSLIGLVTVASESLPRFETKGIDYETLGVAVYRSEGSWYLAGLKGGGREWIHSRSTSKFFPLAEVVMGRLNYLTPSWDSRISDAPGAASPSRIIAAKRVSGEAPGKILESSGSGSALAFKVEVYERSPCETTGPPKVIATGWVSAWAKDGQPNVWFYSRGC